MWESGQQQARKMMSVYANIDVLRPYFDIEPQTLLVRLASSFVPVRSLSQPQVLSSVFLLSCLFLLTIFFQKIPSELYGPLMTVLTLIAILLLNMKNSGTVMVS